MAEGDQNSSGHDGISGLEPHIPGIATFTHADQVSQNFENSTVNVVAGDQTNITINEYNYHMLLPKCAECKSTEEDTESGAEKGFLAKTKLHLRKEIGATPRFPGHPTLMVLDMKGSVTGSSNRNCANQFGRDVEMISIDQIHDAQHEKCHNHVTILGEAGAGKTTLSQVYCLAVDEGNIKTLNNIKLVHFVRAATLQHRSTTTAFNLLFTEQMAHDPKTELSSREQEAGQNWLKDNSGKMLIVIDGLDQCLEQFGSEKYPRVTATTSAKANDIIANIMSKKIWRDARVLTTTRWNTYWDIAADQKPDKAVGLRGLDDKNLEEIAISRSIDGDMMLDALHNMSPKLLPLIRNPMFFNYTTTLYKNDPSALPDTVSGLLSAFFRACLSPSSQKHYNDITRLAYNAMLENRFIFPHSYLRKQGIDPIVLNNLLSTGANLDDGQDMPKSFDKYSQFSHQTMQEFCCALHILNLSPDGIREFVTKQLNYSKMHLTRQLLYGLILNDGVTKLMYNYLANRKTSIEECQSILRENLLGLMENGTIRDMDTIVLLSDCGDETILKIKNSIHKITISDPGMLHGHILLANTIKRLSPVQEVYCDHFYLEPPVIGHFLKIPSHVKIFQVETVGIVDTSLTKKNLEGYLILFRLFRTDGLIFDQCHLAREHGEIIANVWKGLGIQLKILIIVDETMKEDGFEIIAHIAKLSKCTELQLQRSNLTKTKLQSFLRGCRNHDTQFSNLSIIDKSMQEDVYEELTNVVKVVGCSELVFQNCCLTRRKLDGLLRGCRNENIQLPTLVICDVSMNGDEYEQLARVLKQVACKELQLSSCWLTKTKLRGLMRGCRNQNIQLETLAIADPVMPAEVYRYVAEVLNATKCRHANFADCYMSKEKLDCFGMGCRENGVMLLDLTISERHSFATQGDISALCELMTFFVEILSLFHWKIDSDGIRRLKDTLWRNDSKTFLLQCPDEINRVNILKLTTFET